VNLSPPSARENWGASLSVRDGTVRAVFERCLDLDCNRSGVFYRQSSNGTSWTAAERVSTTARDYAWPAGVGFAGRIIVLYNEFSLASDALDVTVRTGT
jgi:hypothetical protein